MSLESRFPSIADLRRHARRRIPHFAWEYLDSATGDETALHRNRIELDKVIIRPSILQGDLAPDLSARFLGRDYPVPFGIAPVGMSGLMWPDAERILARFGAKAGIPYTLSTVASQTPETVGPHAGDQGWFQLYPPRAPEIRQDTLKRAWDSGFHTLALTADVPANSRRERQLRGGLTQPPRITPRIFFQCAIRPVWSVGTLRIGKPRLRTIEKYAPQNATTSPNEHVGYQIRCNPDWDYVKALREEWEGDLVVKGVLNGEDAARLREAGVDAVWVSNHAGRQFAGAQSTLDGLREVRAAVGPDYPLIYDSGVEGGLDILRALALGADFVMLGRAWHYALGALGTAGPDHLFDLLKADMISCMAQIGVNRPKDTANHLF